MSDVCLRQIQLASFRAPAENTDESWYIVRIQDSSEREITNQHRDTDRMFAEFVHALRSSRVALFSLSDLTLTPEFAALVLQAPVVARELSLSEGSFTELTPTEFHAVVLHFSPTLLTFSDCRLCAGQISDEFLRALLAKGVLRVTFPNTVPVDGGRFSVTDDAIVDFCVQEPCSGFGGAGFVQRQFDERRLQGLIEASSVSMRTQSLRIRVPPSRVEDEDLRDFVPHLSYRGRGQRHQLRIYDFHGERHGAVAAMRLQIVLHPDKSLEMIRAQQESLLFYKSDE